MGIHENLGGPLSHLLGIKKKTETVGKSSAVTLPGNFEEYFESERFKNEKGEARDILKEAVTVAMGVNEEWNKLPPNDEELGEQRVVFLKSFKNLTVIDQVVADINESKVKKYFEEKLESYRKEAGDNELLKTNLYKLLRNEMKVISRELREAVGLYEARPKSD
ncbi:MAG: hypothetical protein Q7S34_01540 [bacterium]|nr:hypothetical protein [bacterium]